MQKVLVIVGPTAVGKSGCSIALAKKFQGEIISGDAYQCYQELSIGSAKIKEEEMQGIPHYLVNTVSYKEAFNVKVFQEQARQHIADIAAKKKLPIVCGGTGLYIKSLLYDYVFHEEEVDEVYQKELEQESNEQLHERLQKIDEEASKDLHPNNRKRILRALMMAHLGHKKSEVLEKQEHKLLYDVLFIGLTLEREHLYHRINERVEKMMEDGLEQEVLSLVACEEDFQLQSMQGIGYKEWLGYYRKESTLQETIALIQKNTRNFAKRQYTWFNNQLDIHWYDIEEEGYTEKILADITKWMKE